jgi:hypothetical protein
VPGRSPFILRSQFLSRPPPPSRSISANFADQIDRCAPIAARRWPTEMTRIQERVEMKARSPSLPRRHPPAKNPRSGMDILHPSRRAARDAFSPTEAEPLAGAGPISIPVAAALTPKNGPRTASFHGNYIGPTSSIDVRRGCRVPRIPGKCSRTRARRRRSLSASPASARQPGKSSGARISP